MHFFISKRAHTRPRRELPILSKSKLLTYRQCPKRLWLEVHRPALANVDPGTVQRQTDGSSVGDVARQVYDPEGQGILVDVRSEGARGALSRSLSLLNEEGPLFEAGFSAGGAMSFADVMLRATLDGSPAWRIVEVKSSTSVKPYHEEDAAIQTFVAEAAGVPVSSVAIATIDSDWTYEEEGNYCGLFKETDVTSMARDRKVEVVDWIKHANEILSKGEPPQRQTGQHCSDPYECGFSGYCRSFEPQPNTPSAWLPRVTKRELKALLQSGAASEMADVPESLLSDLQARVKRCTLEDVEYFDAEGARGDLAPHGFPAYFLDFETISFPVPLWLGTRPYQKIPFQFSLHVAYEDGGVAHKAFLSVGGENPSRKLAEALLEACGSNGPVFAYNAGFERSVIFDLANTFPDIDAQLKAIADRLVDLLPVARARYYHPSQQGSWSIKKVLTAVAPDLTYDDLDGVKNGGMAMEAYLEAISPNTELSRKKQIESQLNRYCELDTFAMVRLWQFFRGTKPGA